MSKQFQPPKKGALYLSETIQDKKVQLPEDITQIPDLIVYFAKGKKEKDRAAYMRKAGKSLVYKSGSAGMEIE